MKTGVIDVGGGLREIYAVGIFDYCMDHQIHFDLEIGISGGSANLASFAAGQRGRNYQFYMEYAFRKQYMSVGNFILKRSFIDIDYVYETLSRSDGENPLDYCALRCGTTQWNSMSLQQMPELVRQSISINAISVRMITASSRPLVLFPLFANPTR